MQMVNSARIRLSILTLAIGSVLGIIGLALRRPVPLPNLDVDTWRRQLLAAAIFWRRYYLSSHTYYLISAFGLCMLISQGLSRLKESLFGAL